MEDLVKTESYGFKEIGERAKNGGFFVVKDGAILPTYTHHASERTFGYFDGFSNGKFLNSQIINYVEQLAQTHTHSITVYCLKDFFPKRSLQPVVLKESLVVTVDIDGVEFKNRNVKEVKEAVFNLKELMDEKELSAQAVDLNIKLMMWRQLDQLNLGMLHEVKVLLLGAGTLGCQLARNLIGWGIRNITFVDYGKVSHSNPVRQSLYTFEDVINGGKPKAEAAAESLKRIQPTINTEGHSFEIPMPGHTVTEAEIPKTLENVAKLDKLIQEHNVIFLLLDTREARWLPSVIAAAHDKICFSVALGFDNFIVIRHGGNAEAHKPEERGVRPACYFCNDYMNPSNTMRDRTLDQQCTVTRPGLSFLSSAYASELLVNLLHLTPDDFRREHEMSQDPKLRAARPEEKCLRGSFGLVPQHVRGSASGFNVDLMSSEAYDK